MPVWQGRGYKTFNYDLRLTYSELPIYIEFGLGFGIFDCDGQHHEDGEKKPLFFGVDSYSGFAISGKYIDKLSLIGNPDTKIKFEELVTDNRSRTDYGLMFTAGGQLGRSRFGLFKQIGLKSVIPKARQAKEGNIKTKNFGFFVAFNLKNKK